MNNKYVNVFFYSTIIILMVVCCIGTIKRYHADIYFNEARKCVPAYAECGEYLREMQFLYWEAVRCNPLEAQNYAEKLNGDYIRRITKRR